MIRFILNNRGVSTELPAAMTVLDFIRYHKHLTGTKIGCREGDCGACTILTGELIGGDVVYRSVTSCLTPLANVHNKHVVTIEGLNGEGLNFIQEAMQQASATQCGFCTPGFVVSLAGFCLSGKEATIDNALAAIDGNICRCTGYKSIERAAEIITQQMQQNNSETASDFLLRRKLIPPYFAEIKKRLAELGFSTNGSLKKKEYRLVAGGTDLYVQHADDLQKEPVEFIAPNPLLKGICREENDCIIGAGVTVTELLESDLLLQYFPQLRSYLKLVSSTPIRNIATVGGNIINASPIADLTIFFLALKAVAILSDGHNQRELPLKKLYKAYKSLDKQPGEYLSAIRFALPEPNSYFHFEKVSKRTHLDIATVNSAIMLKTNGNLVGAVCISAGGVAPVPLVLEKASAFLEGKQLSIEVLTDLLDIVDMEISPISDVRGSDSYKRLLLKQLIKAQLLNYLPSLPIEKLLAI